MNRESYEQWLTYLVITISLLAIGYLVGKQAPCPKIAAVAPILDGKPESQQERNVKHSK